MVGKTIGLQVGKTILMGLGREAILTRA